MGARLNMDQDLLDCQRLMRGGSKSFFAASRVLPDAMRQSAMALYAFCRVADDAVDHLAEQGLAHAHSAQRVSALQMQAIESLYQRLEAIYHDRPIDHPADRAFSRLVKAQALPKILPMLLLEGFAWDAQAKRYETIDELETYAVRVAGSVGVMMAYIMGVRHPMVLASACEMGMAMQLTNIARDVGEDARAARLYLPLAWMREAGLEPQAWLAAPSFDPALAAVVSRLLARADALYRSAEGATAHLPWRCRPAIVAAARVYAEIGRELERRGLDSVNQRAVVTAGRKWQLLCFAISQSFLPAHQSLSTESCNLAGLADAIRPLIENLLRSGDADWQSIKPRQASGVERLAAVFERLEKLDRQQRAKQHPGFSNETGSMASGTSQ